ncbi:hypothetical protein M5E87_16080 [Flavonifractor plautii]|nr:hypothetical protein M5E87_16080 [Flavonifractor plautii]
MQTSMKLLLTAPPDQCRAALRFGLPVAHVAYRVGAGPTCSGPASRYRCGAA